MWKANSKYEVICYTAGISTVSETEVKSQAEYEKLIDRLETMKVEGVIDLYLVKRAKQ